MPIKVCHVISSLKMGGAQQLLGRLCESAGSPEFEHTIICLTEETKLASVFRNKGVKVSCLDLTSNLQVIKGILQLRRLLKIEQAHLVQTWLYHADFMTALAMYDMRSTPLIWSVHHANEKFEGDKKVTKWLVRALAGFSKRFPSAIIYCSQYAKKVHQEFGYKPRRCLVINNGVDTQRFSPSLELRSRFRSQHGIGSTTTVIGMVARYAPVKGYDVFLKMARELLALNSDIRFVLVGTDVDENNQELNRSIGELALTEHCLLLGELSYVESVMNGMDILVCPSFSESFGLVVVEALACGVPVVCSNLRSLKMLAGEKLSVPVGESHLFAEEVYRLISAGKDCRKAIGNKGRKRIVEKFDVGGMVAEYKNVYRELC